MRTVIIVILIMLALTSCQKDPLISMEKSNQDKIIALQPLGIYDEQQLLMLRAQISNFYNIRVRILKPIDIPVSFRSSYEEKYSADSLIQFLSKLSNDTLVEIVGLTHKDIYKLHEHHTILNQKDTILVSSTGIFGLGYIPGNACVVSDHRLMTTDKELWNNRLRKVVIHEIGHNLGIPHCPDDTCLMSESNGNIVQLNSTGGDYCKNCRQKWASIDHQ